MKLKQITWYAPEEKRPDYNKKLIVICEEGIKSPFVYEDGKNHKLNGWFRELIDEEDGYGEYRKSRIFKIEYWAYESDMYPGD